MRSEATALEKILQRSGALGVQKATTEKACDAIWGLRRVYSQSLKATGLKKLNEDIVVPRGRLVDLMRFAARLQKKSGFPIACFGHAGDGNIHVNIMVADPENPEVQKIPSCTGRTIFAGAGLNGAITGEHGIGIAKNLGGSRPFPRPLGNCIAF